MKYPYSLPQQQKKVLITLKFQFNPGSPLFCCTYPASEANSPEKWKYGLIGMEIALGKIKRPLKKIWQIQDRKKMPLFLNILNQIDEPFELLWSRQFKWKTKNSKLVKNIHIRNDNSNSKNIKPFTTIDLLIGCAVFILFPEFQ